MARISVENDAYLQKTKNFIEPMLNQEKSCHFIDHKVPTPFIFVYVIEIIII